MALILSTCHHSNTRKFIELSVIYEYKNHHYILTIFDGGDEGFVAVLLMAQNVWEVVLRN